MAELTWHEAIQHVLAERASGMHCSEITDRIIELGLRENLGATPQNIVRAQLATSVRRKGTASPYVKVAKATFALRELLVASESGSGMSRDDRSLDAEDDDTGLIQAFGMYWMRDSVHWAGNTSLLGRQEVGATVVDFADQRGVYLLHDGREVIYVGRATDRGIGPRLHQHTHNRLRSRWDRFSWFGLRRVAEDGELCSIAYTPSEEIIAVTLEALLIEGLEPRQNRKRGDGFTAVEYLQAEDPEVARQRAKNALDAMKARL